MKKFLLLILLTGCVPAGDDRPLAQGFTPCNELPGERDGIICHPNQYCADPHLQWCHRGCLSDDNCSQEQICVKNRGSHLGSCLAIDALPEEDPQLDPGYTTCGDPATPARYEICHPSQHCYSDRDGTCAAGCLSELNCTDHQICEKLPGENVGVCVHNEQ